MGFWYNICFKGVSMTKQEALNQLDEVWNLLGNIKQYQFALKISQNETVSQEIIQTQLALREATVKIVSLREALAKM